MWRARSTVDPGRRELAPLRLSSESRAAREKPSLARSCALGARSCPLRLAHAVGLFENCYKSSGIRTPAFHVRGRSGDFLLACPASRRHSRAGGAALGHPASSCARRPGRRPACHGRGPRCNRARAWRHGLYDRSRLLAVLCAQVDEPSRGERLNQFSPRACRPRNADDLRALSKKTTRMTMPADVESYSTKSRPCCLRVIDLDIILVDPWHA